MIYPALTRDFPVMGAGNTSQQPSFKDTGKVFHTTLSFSPSINETP
jgi:hypothetical protein